jgi:hypothetical protein
MIMMRQLLYSCHKRIIERDVRLTQTDEDAGGRKKQLFSSQYVTHDRLRR